MHLVRYNTLAIHREIIGGIRYAFKNDAIGYLEKSKDISYYTNLNKLGMQNVMESLHLPTQVFAEILNGLYNEKSFTKEEKYVLKATLKDLNSQTTKIKNNLLDDETYKNNLVKLNRTILNTIDKYCNSDCVEGTKICSNCKRREEKSICVRNERVCQVKFCVCFEQTPHLNEHPISNEKLI